ncbi:unnamed protein product [Spodoptera exigua]|nr:unnamed protein product [Spodoptera exigua]
MSRLQILFIVAISIIGPLKTLGSANNNAVDLNSVLNFIQQLKESSDSSSTTDDKSEEYFTESDHSTNNRDEILEKERIIDLIEKAAKEHRNKVENDDSATYHKEKPDRDELNQLNQNEKLSDTFDNNIRTQILAKLLSQDLNEESKTKPRLDYTKKRVKPNSLSPTLSVNEVNSRNDNEVSGLDNNYSKIYVVLNPLAVEKSKNKNAFNEL